MSVQFGRWNLDGKPTSSKYLEDVKLLVAPFGPDGGTSWTRGAVSILYHAFHTTKESRFESQPCVTKSGAVVTWDGRLDNRAELVALVGNGISIDSADASIVAAAYEHSAADCFAMIIGDWALSIWNPTEQSLFLAKDLIGTRPLFYSHAEDAVVWSTILDPLVLLAGKTLPLNEEYIAGCLASFPATHLTPYAGVHSVPPSCYVRLGKRAQIVKKYWDFNPAKKICYRNDADYEEHFRLCFSQSVKRRLRSNAPILAELSGGVDSSSIVSVADVVCARSAGEFPRLDTISYYDNSEPNWNERPYFTRLEEKRGRIGCHIDMSSGGTPNFEFEDVGFRATPGSAGNHTRGDERFAAIMTSHGSRVVLSGIGGDEVLGGVPTPIPELADLLARARFKTLAHALRAWALNKRKPWFHLLFEAARGFLPLSFIALPEHRRPAPWLMPGFVKRNRDALIGYEHRLKLLGPLPTFQENVSALNGLQRQLACVPLSLKPLYEKRYPYLDRDLLEFIWSIPRQQLVRPGQRRSLMRRALWGIVPDEILNRKRKAFRSRAPLVGISKAWTSLMDVSHQMATVSAKVIDPEIFIKSLQEARDGQSVPLVPLMRTLWIHFWLQHLNTRGMLASHDDQIPGIGMVFESTLISAEKN